MHDPAKRRTIPNQESNLIEKRREQILPVFSFEELERSKAFGTVVQLKKNDRLTTTERSRSIASEPFGAWAYARWRRR
ncbi:hypothetical protein MTsN3n11_04750 [Qipengyuania sp. MTN3-11]